MTGGGKKKNGWPASPVGVRQQWVMVFLFGSGIRRARSVMVQQHKKQLHCIVSDSRIVSRV